MKDEIWFVCSEENGKKIVSVLLKHGLQFTMDLWDKFPDMER